MKFGPTLARVARTVFDGETDTVLETAAPLVGAFVGLRRDELVDQVAFGTHDLDTIVARLLRQLRAARVVADGLADAPSCQRARRKAVDRRPQLRRRDIERVIAIAPGMQYLQGNLAARGVDRIGDDPVLGVPARESSIATRNGKRARPGSAQSRR